MVKLCVVLLMVAAGLLSSAFAKHLTCNMKTTQRCSFSSVKLYHDEVMQTEFFSQYPSKVTKVEFVRSSLAAIPPILFQTFLKLETVDAHNSHVERVYSNTFEDAKALKALSLRGNQITELLADAFYGANRLEWLDLSDNLIATVHSTAFRHLSNLKTLRLNDNHISHLHSTLFDELSEMERLELQENDLTTIGDLVFSGCPSLMFLNVSHNALKTFHLNKLDRRYNFDLIDVSHNHLEFVNIPGCLRQLYASKNDIHTVESSGTQSALVRLKLSRNKISSIADIPTFAKLTYLDMSYNRLNDFECSSMTRFPKLALLQLHGNQFDASQNQLLRITVSDLFDASERCVTADKIAEGSNHYCVRNRRDS